jgi:uncharacterized protein YcbK (DUF882 family)
VPPEPEKSKEPQIGVIFNAHTLESLPLTETEPSVEAFSALLEDRGMQVRARMDPRLLELMRTIARKRQGTRFEIISGFRSPKRNEMMRKKGRNVASHSQHTVGGAIDLRIEGMSAARVYGEIVRLKWDGGLGVYPGGRDRFVHVDVGPKRRWWGH